MVLSALFGFISGILGGLLIANIYAPIYGIKEEFNRPPPARGGAQRDAERASRAQSSLVTFYVNRGRPPVAEDRVGYGTLLTADGWIVTTSRVMRNGALKTVAVTADRTPHVIERMASDIATDAVFVRISGERFTALGGGSSRELPRDAYLFSVDSAGRFYRPNFLGVNYPEGVEAEVQSSEKLRKFLFVGKMDGLTLPGGSILNSSGDIVGIILDPAKGQAIPFEYLVAPFRELLRSGKPARVYLGVNFIDLGATSVKRKEGERGALLVGTSKVKAVLPGSPAENAGFIPGDIILKVDEDELSSRVGLSESIAGYEPREVLRINLRHADGVEETKEVTLGARP